MTNVFSAILNIAAATFLSKRGSLIAFGLSMAAFQYIIVASYPAIGGAAAVEGVVRTFPPGLRRLLKIVPNLQAGFGLRDYVALGFFHPVFLGLGSAFVVGRATDALAGQVERGSIYLLLSRPVPRWALVVGKAVELGVGAGLLAMLAWLGTAVGVWTTSLPEPLQLDRYLQVAFAAWALFAALGAGALVISSCGSRTGWVVGLGSAWTLISFVLDVLPLTAEPPLALINPWHHYDPQGLAATGTMDSVGLVVLLVWSICGTALAPAVFARRDLA